MLELGIGIIAPGDVETSTGGVVMPMLTLPTPEIPRQQPVLVRTDDRSVFLVPKNYCLILKEIVLHHGQQPTFSRP